MSKATYKEAIEAVSRLLDCVDASFDGSSVGEAKIAVSYIQQSELLRRELLDAIEDLLQMTQVCDDGQYMDYPGTGIIFDNAKEAIAKAKGEQG